MAGPAIRVFHPAMVQDVDARHKAGHEIVGGTLDRQDDTTDDPLVTTDWLAARLDDPRSNNHDASYKMPGVLAAAIGRLSRRAYSRCGVFRCQAIADPNDPRPHMYPDAEQFARDVVGARYSSGDTVVAYDSGAWGCSTAGWWMFLSFGHPK